MGGNGVTNLPGVTGGMGVSDGPGVASVGSTQTLGLNFFQGVLDPRITYARTSTATVTDFEGIIKPTDINEARFDGLRRVKNLLTYSQDFSNAAWVKSVVSPIGGYAAPDGTLTAYKITSVVGTSGQGVYRTYTVSLYAASIYVKYGGKQFVQMYGFTSERANFDLLNGIVTAVSAGCTASMASIGGGWYRCSFYGATATTATVFAGLIDSGTAAYNATTVGDGVSGIYIWGAQLEDVTGQSNQNPSEYVSTNAIRRNLLTYSQDFSNAAWIKNNLSTTTGFTAPDGTNTAIKIAVNTSVFLAHDNEQVVTTSANNIIAHSIYVKAGEYTFANFSITGDTNNTYYLTTINLTSGAITNTASAAATLLNYSITSVGGGWYRVSITGSINATQIYLTIGPATTGTPTYDIYGREAFVGVIGSGIYIWGAQLEVGSVATAYQPVTNAAPLDFGNYQGTGADGVQYFNYTNATPPVPLTTGKGLLIEEGRTNSLLNSAVFATQSVTTTATSWTLSFWGTGTCTLAGAFVSVVTGTGASVRTTFTFTSTAAVLVMTVTGSCTNAQLEAGAFATSYMPTGAGAFNRAADTASMTGTNFSSWYNQSEGTMYCEFDAPNMLVNPTAGVILNGDNFNYSPMYIQQLTAQTKSYDGITLTIIGSNTPTTNNKNIISYTATNITGAVNGVIGGSGSYTKATTTTILGIGSNNGVGTSSLNGHIKQIKYYSKALPASILQELTS